jgi:hypothetical protein
MILAPRMFRQVFALLVAALWLFPLSEEMSSKRSTFFTQLVAGLTTIVLRPIDPSFDLHGLARRLLELLGESMIPLETRNHLFTFPLGILNTEKSLDVVLMRFFPQILWGDDLHRSVFPRIRQKTYFADQNL